MSKLAIRSYASDYKIYKGLQVSPIQRITDNIYSNETHYPDAYTAMKSPANTRNKPSLQPEFLYRWRRGRRASSRTLKSEQEGFTKVATTLISKSHVRCGCNSMKELQVMLEEEEGYG